MPNTNLYPVKNLRRSHGRYVRPTRRQVALFCYLAKMLWKLSCRIPWGRLSDADYGRLAEVRPMLTRIDAKARTARLRQDMKDRI